ncbi:AAA family ATPase [Pseudomonadota bacterium]
MESIAKSSRRRKVIVNSVDEKTRSAIQDLIHNLFNPEYLNDTTYINHLTKTILSIVHKHNAVILGRGSNFIVPSETSLNVLITAPKKIRISRAMEYDKLTFKEAQKRINKTSQERRDFISQYFHKRYTNPKHYDLILNTTYYDIDTASDLIISAFRKKFPSFSELVKTTIKKTGKLY